MKRISALCGVLLFLCGCHPAATLILPTNQAEAYSASQDETYEFLNRWLDSFMNQGDTLPSTILDDIQVTWRVVSGAVTLGKDNVLQKGPNAQEKEPFVLEAHTVDAEGKENTYTFDHLLLLDEYAAYLMVYFGGEGEEYENPKLAYTYDCLHWYKLNQDDFVLKATTGSRRIRDPYILRKKDGTFSLIATQGWDHPSIYVWDSMDLTSFTNERLFQVNTTSDALPLQETQAWAPEGFYDRRSDTYILYWSSVVDGGLFYNTSSDLTSFSYPERLCDTGYPIIDGTIYKEQENYYLIAKDEREPMEEHSQLFLGLTDSDYFHFDTFLDPFSGHEAEGPFILQDGGQTFLYYDDYTRHQFHVMTSWWIPANDFEQRSDYDMVFTIDAPRHASVIPLTWKELQGVIEAYGSDE